MKKEKNKLSQPFDNTNIKQSNFNEKEIRKKLLKIIPKKDHNLIHHIINDKKHYFPNKLKIERGIFRDDNFNIIGIVKGDCMGFTIPPNIRSIGIKNGFSIMSHNHINGLIIPSKKDIATMMTVKSHYNPIYSPNLTGIFINNNTKINQDDWENISNKYNTFHEKIELSIEEANLKEVKKLRNAFKAEILEEKLAKLYRQYYVKNQSKIVKEINILLEKNMLKLYIL